MPTNERNDIINDMNKKFRELLDTGKTIEQAYATMIVKNPSKGLQGCSFDFMFKPFRSQRLKNVPSETEVSFQSLKMQLIKLITLLYIYIIYNILKIICFKKRRTNMKFKSNLKAGQKYIRSIKTLKRYYMKK